MFRNAEQNGDLRSAFSNQLGSRLRGIRQDRGWSLRQLATMIDVSPATLSAIENGRTNVTVERLVSLADVLGTSAVRLVGKEALRTEKQSVRRNGTAMPVSDDWRSFFPLQIDAILAAAIDAFVETGYHGSTMRDIAQRAGMSVPGVYHHYSNKQSLLIEILDMTMDDLEWRILAARDSQQRPSKRVGAIVESLALFHVQRADLAFIGASEMRSLDEPERRRIAKRRSAVQLLLDIEIGAALESGSAHTMMPKETGRAIATMCTSLPQWFNASGATNPQQIAREYSKVALKMIGASDDE